jgi:hypothetical protein
LTASSKLHQLVFDVRIVAMQGSAGCGSCAPGTALLRPRGRRSAPEGWGGSLQPEVATGVELAQPVNCCRQQLSDLCCRTDASVARGQQGRHAQRTCVHDVAGLGVDV